MTDPDAFGGSGGLIAVDPGSGRQTTVSRGGLFVDPADVAIARDGTIIVSDLEAFGGIGGLIRVDPGNGQQTKISASEAFQRPLGIVIDANGQVVVAYTERPQGHGVVMRVNPANGEHHAVIPDFRIIFPGFLTLEANGNVIVSEPDTAAFASNLHRLDTAGHATTLTTNRPPGAIYSGVAVDGNGAILLVDGRSFPPQALLRVDPATGVPTTISQGDRLVSPIGLAVEQSGRALVIDRVNGVVRVDPSTGAQSIVSTGDTFDAPLSAAVVRG